MLPKLISLAALAAIVATALVGASAAQADTHVIGLCLKAESLCTGSGLSGVVKVKAHANKAELKNTGFFKTTEVCESDTTVEAEGMKSPMTGSVTALTFTNCTGPCTKAESKNLPWTGEVTMPAEWLEVDMYLQTTTKGGARLSGCTFGTECEYGVPTGKSVSLLGAGNTVKAEGVTLEYKSGSGAFVCGSSGTWTATYTIETCELANGTKHTPCYLTLLPEEP